MPKAQKSSKDAVFGADAKTIALWRFEEGPGAPFYADSSGKRLYARRGRFARRSSSRQAGYHLGQLETPYTVLSSAYTEKPSLFRREVHRQVSGPMGLDRWKGGRFPFPVTFETTGAKDLKLNSWVSRCSTQPTS